MPSITTFCTVDCASKFKVVGACKLQVGYAGFSGNRQTRYLQRVITYTAGPDNSSTTPVTGLTQTQTNVVDRITFAISSDHADGLVSGGTTYDFGFNSDYQGAGTYNDASVSGTVYRKHTVTIISDTHMTKVLTYCSAGSDVNIAPTNTYTIDIVLSNPYTLAQLEADADAILATVDVSAMPWNSLQYGAGDQSSSGTGPRDPDGNKFSGFPPFIVTYGNAVPTTATVQSARQGVGWSWYLPGGSGGTYGPAGTFLKAISYIKILGQYSVQSYPATWPDGDATTVIGSPACTNGTTTCGSSIATITPPAIDADTNHYLLFTPGGRC